MTARFSWNQRNTRGHRPRLQSKKNFFRFQSEPLYYTFLIDTREAKRTGTGRSFVYRWLLAVTILLSPELRAQDSTSTPNGRLAQIQQQRVDKAASLGASQPAKTGGPLSRLAPVFHYVPIGFDVGGLGTGAGPAVNVAFRKTA